MSRRKKEMAEVEALWGKLETAPSAMAMSPWHGVDSEKLMSMVIALTRNGDACLLGVTSDGGAGTILLFAGGQKKRLYGADENAINDTLDMITEWATDKA